jgi:hypothetical protein
MAKLDSITKNLLHLESSQSNAYSFIMTVDRCVGIVLPAVQSTSASLFYVFHASLTKTFTYRRFDPQSRNIDAFTTLISSISPHMKL